MPFFSAHNQGILTTSGKTNKNNPPIGRHLLLEGRAPAMYALVSAMCALASAVYALLGATYFHGQLIGSW